MESSTGLDALTAPRSVVVVGASLDTSKIGGRVFTKLRDDFRGVLFAVTKRDVAELGGVPAARSVGDVDAAIDLAVVSVPGPQAIQVLRECCAAGVKAVILLSSDVPQTDENGTPFAEVVARMKQDHGLRVLGPNSLGVIDFEKGLFATFFSLLPTHQEPLIEDTVVISQSGAMGAWIVRNLLHVGVGVRAFVATGNQADVSVSELVEHYSSNPAVRAVAVCSESFDDAEQTRRSLLSARAANCLVIWLQLGSTETGARGAQSHTGALVADSAAVETVLRASSAIQVDSPEALVDFTAILRSDRRVTGDRVGIFTTSGGMGILLADISETRGLQVPTLDDDDTVALRTVIPSFGSVTNPIDITAEAQVRSDLWKESLQLTASLDQVDMVCTYGVNSGFGRRVDDVIDVHRATEKPIISLVQDDAAQRKLNAARIPAVRDSVRMIGAIAAGRRWSEFVPPVSSEVAVADVRLSPDHFTSGPWMDQIRLHDVLSSLGIPTPPYAVVDSSDEAVSAAARIGYPVVMKLSDPALLHKTEVDAVVVGINSDVELRESAGRLFRNADEHGFRREVMVQKQITPSSEYFVGALRRPGFPAIVTAGLGGRMVEIVGAFTSFLADEPDEMIDRRIRGLADGRLVSHVRGLSEAGVQRLVSICSAVGSFMLSNPEVTQVDLNPLLYVGSDFVAVDGIVGRA